MQPQRVLEPHFLVHETNENFHFQPYSTDDANNVLWSINSHFAKDCHIPTNLLGLWFRCFEIVFDSEFTAYGSPDE